jgi:uroporphyrinogen-III synthase
VSRVLVTRPAARAGDAAALLQEAGLEPVCLPLVETRPVADLAPLDGALARLPDYDWVAFASASAAEIVLDRARHLDVPLGRLATPRVCAGPATATILVEGGWRADLVVAPYTAERAAGAMRSQLGVGRGAAPGQRRTRQGRVCPGGATQTRRRSRAGWPGEGMRVLLPRASAGRDVLATSLRAAGAVVDDLPLYETVPDPARAAEAAARLLEGAFRAVLFFSPSAVESLRSALSTSSGGPGAPRPAGVLVACIGPTTADAAARAGWRVDLVAPDTTLRSLVDALTARLAPFALPVAGGGR